MEKKILQDFLFWHKNKPLKILIHGVLVELVEAIDIYC